MPVLDPAADLDLRPIAFRVVTEIHAAPSAVVAAAARRHGRWRHGLGSAGRLWFEADAPAATPDTIFDLASVTKPVTALTLARLTRAKKIDRREALADVIPALAGTRSARVPIDLFAAHRAGLDGHRPIYAKLRDGGTVSLDEALVIAADARRADCDGDPPPEGFPPVYSDLGYLLLGAAIAARSGAASRLGSASAGAASRLGTASAGADLDETLDREVIAPLGLAMGSARQLRAKNPRFDADVAPTEIVPWRGGVVRGAVHDENAWAIVGDAAAGHAGLFGDARSVVDLGVAVLDVLAGRRPDWLDPADLAPVLRDRPGGSHLAGFDRRSGPAPLSGARFGPRTFGHLGFTGTSLWIDPDAELVGVLLTNRVHPTRETTAIRAARPMAYDAIVDAFAAV